MEGPNAPASLSIHLYCCCENAKNLPGRGIVTDTTRYFAAGDLPGGST
jgi:hypothetical protein